MIGLTYRIECPGEIALAQFKALKWNLKAFNLHLIEDRCPKCSKDRDSDVVNMLASIIEGTSWLTDVAEKGWAAPTKVVEWLKSLPNRARILWVPLRLRHTLGEATKPQTNVTDGESSAQVKVNQKDFQLSINAADRKAGFVITPMGQGLSFQMEKQGEQWRAGIQGAFSADPPKGVLVILTPEP